MRISDWSSDVCSSDLIDRKPLEIGERRIARAEIVHRDLRIKALQGFEHTLRALRIVDDRAFRQLDLQMLARQAGAGQRLTHRFHHIVARKLNASYVEAPLDSAGTADGAGPSIGQAPGRDRVGTEV